MTSPEAPLLPLLGDDWRVLHPRRTEDGEGGGDLDLAVRGLDPLWPLRLTDGWRLCHCIHYDLCGWTWVLDRDGSTVAVDTLDDPRGLGRMRFPTGFAFHGPRRDTPPAVKAAYLTGKRLYKGIRESQEWERIGALARPDPSRYVRTLEPILGRNLARAVSDRALQGCVPPEPLWFAARSVQLLRPLRNPGRVAHTGALRILRLWRRSRRPTGLFLLLAGPDGSGKSTLLSQLPGACAGLFHHEASVHWRPSVLPRPAALLGRPQGEVTDPHGRPPHGRVLSYMLLLYYWLDFVAGSWIRLRPLRTRTGLAIVERGWWDIAVDPARYRLQVPPRLVSVLGRVVPSPDLILALEAPPEVLLARKSELSSEELTRQMQVWRQISPTRSRTVVLDATSPKARAVAVAREEIARLLETRAVSRLGPGWAGLPRTAAPRWTLPRGPRRVARSALFAYQPVTARGRLGWEAARALAGLGGFRLLPRGEAPPRAVREALAPHIPRLGTVAVARANHTGRYVAVILGSRGELRVFAKVATDEAGRRNLASEVKALARFQSLLAPPLQAPEVRAYEDGILLLEPVPWLPRARPWRLPPEVARSLGAFFRAGAGSITPLVGTAHGDCAPWNLLRTADGWTLIDWEEAQSAAPPFRDILHYLVQAHLLLKRPTARALLAGTAGKGWVGASLDAYCEGACLDPSNTPSYLRAYLEERLNPGASRSKEVGSRRRVQELLAALSPTTAPNATAFRLARSAARWRDPTA